MESSENELLDLCKDLPLKNSNLNPLSPFVDQDLIRVGRCIGAAYISYSSKHQVLISNKHPLASLLVFYVHITNFHSGRELTLSLEKTPGL